MNLIPYLQFATENLNAFDQLAKSVTSQHLDSIREHLSSEQLMILNESREWLQVPTSQN